MEHKQKFTQNIVKLLLLCVFLYASLFYIAPFVAENIAKLIGTTKQISVQTRVNSPSLSNFQELTNKDSITFQGVSSGNASVELFLNDSSYGKVTAETDGKFKFEDVSIIKGKNKIYLIAKNSEGIESPKSKEYNFDFDDKKPEIKTINLSNGQTVTNLNKTVTITGETNEYSEIEINGKKVFKKDANKFEYLLGVTEGEISVEVKLIDKAGNENKYFYNITYKKG
jgi:hypothetical protein